ncbi:tyrosine-type recombinase/integrase [Roseivivax jejudonensis]|uniref:tyrosine-type recombinase/integrase n=1 Tax=Roseivivax jejudonensis TaxID=1529041 RepID=UPI0013564170|nr:tyrosine-type recombinase/integrase [Roseivivax jejudonensis]
MKGLWTHPKTGQRYFRTRRGGKPRLVKLPSDLPIDHPDFIAAWAAAAKELAPPKAHATGTIGSTFKAALASDRFHTFSEGYRATVTRQAEAVIAKVGGVKASAVEQHHIRADMNSSPNPEARLKAWRFWAGFCIEKSWLRADPTVGLRKPKRLNTGGHPTWSLQSIAAFRAAYPIGTTCRAIMELTYWAGARIGDVVKIGRPHIDADGVLCFRQGKTQDMAYVPWTCTLPAYARGMEADRQMCMDAIAHLGPGLTFLQTNRKRARSHKSAGQDISAACRAIGLELSAHGLRKARAVALANAGGTTSQIGAWTGHRSLSEIAHYTAEMDRRGAVRGVDPEHVSENSADPQEKSGSSGLKSIG